MTSPTITTHADPPSEWDVVAAASGTFYHRSDWTLTLARAFGFVPHFVVARVDQHVSGILPMLEVPPLLGPRRLVSLPFSYAAGPASRDSDTRLELMAAARALATERGLRLVEIKQRAPDDRVAEGFVRVVHYNTYVVDTSLGEEAVWRGLHPNHVRRGIKKAKTTDLVAVAGTSRADWLEMARLQEHTSHRNGLPAPPREFFATHCRALQERGAADLLLARRASGGAIAGIVLWKGAREWIYAFGASLPEHWDLRPNHLLLWTALEQALHAGVAFDLGRASPEQKGLVEFKTRWGAQPVPLAYDYHPTAAGLNTASRDSGALDLAGRVWRRLPFAMARRASFLYRYLG